MTATAIHVDALVIGAGPAGSSAAIQLARGAARVALVDRHDFPRDKACGDALIPDALRALERLSLKAQVLARARALGGLRLYAPDGRRVVLAGECASLPRATFDALLQREAVRQGARFYPGFQLTAALRSADGVEGAVFSGRAGQLTVRAGVTLLATGAAPGPLQRFDVCERVSPSATAARIYVRAGEPPADGADALCISFDRAICPGYGWIFPGPDGVFNVGVGYFHDAAAWPPETHIRRLLERFLAGFPPAVELMKRCRPLTSLKGAPLRTALTGARLAMPGLLTIGEAAGTTYSFSGEGIGKAMESGLLAAEAILTSASGDRRAIAGVYSARVRESFTDRFRAYRVAQDWLSRPAIANLLAWRAGRSPFVQRELEALFQETSDPRRLFSMAGMVRSLVS